jgi:nucleotide-binding universal stress UspA family protein
MKTHQVTNIERAVRTALAREMIETQHDISRPVDARSGSAASGTIQIKRILLPTDFSPISVKAIDHACSFARLFHAEVIFLNVIPPVHAPAYCPAAAAEELRETHRMEAEEALASLVHTAQAPGRGGKLRVRAMVAEGDAALETERVARECNVDLIVIASHGFTGLKHLLLGSTAEKVVRHAPCPVLVIRGDAAQTLPHLQEGVEIENGHAPEEPLLES